MEIRLMITTAKHTNQALPRFTSLKSMARNRLASLILPGILALLGVLSPAFAPAQDAAPPYASQLVGGKIDIFAGSKDPNAPSTFDNVQADISRILSPNFMVLDADGNL